MVITFNGSSAAAERQSRRRQVVIDEAVDHALQIMGESGVGALSVSEVARRMGLRSPALYRYFDSLGDLYDSLFALGQEQNAQAVHEAITDTARGVDRIRIGTRATVRWCVTHPALAQLLYWRVVPGFEPTEQTFAAGVGVMDELRAEFAEAVRQRQLDPRADSEEAVRLLTVQMSGLITQQLANEPGATFEEGVFTRLTDEAITIVLDHYRPGGQHADT